MSIIKNARSLLSDFGFLPIEFFRRLRAVPYYIRNIYLWSVANCDSSFRICPTEIRFLTWERFAAAGGATGHYFHQDLWVACAIFRSGLLTHVDVGSRLDGFIAHLLPFCRVTFVDLRELKLEHSNFTFIQGTITKLPFKDFSLSSLSCLHVIEHIGLGRYGDAVDPTGYKKAAAELVRVLAPNGRLYLSTPVGKERVVYDAHRVFNPRTIVEAFAPAKLISFNLITDAGDRVIENASFGEAQNCTYGCGIFIFERGL